MAFSTQQFRNSLAHLELKGSDTYSTPTYIYRAAVLWSGPAVCHDTLWERWQRHHSYLQTILHGLWGTVITGTLMLMPSPLIPAWGAGILAATETQHISSMIDGLGVIYNERECRRWVWGLLLSWNTIDAIAAVLQHHTSLRGLTGKDRV